MIHFRALFDDLVGAKAPAARETEEASLSHWQAGEASRHYGSPGINSSAAASRAV